MSLNFHTLKAERVSRGILLRGSFSLTDHTLLGGLPVPGKWAGVDYLVPGDPANVNYLRDSMSSRITWSPVTATSSNAVAPAIDLFPLRADHPFGTTPRPYQYRAVTWAAQMPYFGLVMDPGTGKTKVLWDVVCHHFETSILMQALILAPNGVHEQWINEQMHIHFPASVLREVDYNIYTSGKKLKWRRTGARRILSMNIEAMSHNSGVVEALKFVSAAPTMLIIDESSRIKNSSASRTKAVLALSKKVPVRAIATGTPVTKGVEDLFSQLAALSPEIIGIMSRTGFINRYCITKQIRGAPIGAVEIVGYRNLEELLDKISPFIFNMTLAEAAPEIPEPIRSERHIMMTPEQRRIYKELREEMAARIAEGTIDAVNGAVLITRLQQVLSGWAPVSKPDEEEGVDLVPVASNRMEALLDILSNAPGKVVVWARFRADVTAIVDALTKAGHDVVRYDGETERDDRRDAIERFVRGAANVFVGNPAAAGIGLNLQVAQTVVYYSNSFDAEARWQSEARTHRIGTKFPVHYIDLVVPGSVDVHIISSLKRKENVANSLIRDPLRWLQEEAETNAAGTP